MHDPRPGAMNYPTAIESAKTREADGIDRMKQILGAAVDHGHYQVELVKRAIDRIAGSAEEPESPPTPTPPYQDMTVYQLLGQLEMVQKEMDQQLARIREQLP